jgi:hypothetical protein
MFVSRRLNTGRSHNTKIANKCFEDVMKFRLMNTAACRKGMFAAVLLKSGPGSSVGIATTYVLDGPGIEFRWGRDFPHLSCTKGNGSFPGVSCGRGVTLTSHPLLVPRSKIE